jgi:hypothetical protein
MGGFSNRANNPLGSIETAFEVEYWTRQTLKYAQRKECEVAVMRCLS